MYCLFIYGMILSVINDFRFVIDCMNINVVEKYDFKSFNKILITQFQRSKMIFILFICIYIEHLTMKISIIYRSYKIK